MIPKERVISQTHSESIARREKSIGEGPVENFCMDLGTEGRLKLND